MDITQAFEATGAVLTTTNTLKHALILVEHDGLAGAILDHVLGDGQFDALCQRLYTTVEGPCKDALHISKPAADGALVAAMEGLIIGAAHSPTELSPLLVEQRRVGDEYRVIEKVIQELRNLHQECRPSRPRRNGSRCCRPYRRTDASRPAAA